MNYEHLPEKTPEAITFDACSNHIEQIIVAVIPLWSCHGEETTCMDGVSCIRIASCCVSHAMLFGWNKACEINAKKCLTQDPMRVVGVLVRVLDGEEEADARRKISQMKKGKG